MCVKKQLSVCLSLSLSLSLSVSLSHETMIIDISLHVLLPTCVVLLQAAHTFCVSVLYVHVVFDDKHVLMRVRARVCLHQI